MMKRSFNLAFFSFFVLGLFGCEKIERSAISKNLAEAKSQGIQLRQALNFYKLKHSSFPESLQDLQNIKSNYTYDSDMKLNRFIIGWEYTTENDRRQCRLRTLKKVDGYYVSILSNGELEASEVDVPNDDRHLWSGGRDSSK